MKKIFLSLFATAAITLLSCNKIQEINADFGATTYSNDFTELVNAIKDLRNTLENRFNALNQAIQSGNESLVASINSNTGAINVMNQNLDSALSDVQATLFDGFKAINQTVDEFGDNVVTAIDDNFNLLSLSLDKNGKILETAVFSSIGSLQKELKSGQSSLVQKLDLVASAVKTGFADSDKSSLLVKNAIDNLSEQVKSGNLSQDEALAAIKTAIKGQTIALVIKLNAIEAAIEAQTLSLDTSLPLIKEAIEGNGTQLADIITALNSIKTQMETIEETQRYGFDNIVAVLMNEAEDEGVIIPTGTTDVNDPNYDPAKDPTYNTYLTPATWERIEKAYEAEVDKENPVTNDGKTYKALTENLVVYNAEIHAVQAAYYYGSFDSLHPHAVFTKESEDDPIIIGSEVTENDTEIIRVIKAAGDITYSISIDTNQCSYTKLFEVEVFDAESQLKYNLGKTDGISVHDFKVVDDDWNWTTHYVNDDDAQHPFRVDWSGNQYKSISGIKLKTFYKDEESGKTLIVDKIYFVAKAAY